MDVVRHQAPRVGELDAAFGAGRATEWLLVQLRALFRVTTERNAPVQAELIDFAPDFVTDCAQVKLTEMMIFFSGYRSGRFGESFALPSPRTVGLAFRRDFLPYLRRLREEASRRVQEQRVAERPRREPGAVTREEYERMTEFPLIATVRRAEGWTLLERCVISALPPRPAAWPAEVRVVVGREGLHALNEELFRGRTVTVRSVGT